MLSNLEHNRNDKPKHFDAGTSPKSGEELEG